MKTATNLKSGSLGAVIQGTASDIAAQVVDFVGSAQQQAKSMTDGTAGAADALWQGITGWLKR